MIKNESALDWRANLKTYFIKERFKNGVFSSLSSVMSSPRLGFPDTWKSTILLKNWQKNRKSKGFVLRRLLSVFSDSFFIGKVWFWIFCFCYRFWFCCMLPIALSTWKTINYDKSLYQNPCRYRWDFAAVCLSFRVFKNVFSLVLLNAINTRLIWTECYQNTVCSLNTTAKSEIMKSSGHVCENSNQNSLE